MRVLYSETIPDNGMLINRDPDLDLRYMEKYKGKRFAVLADHNGTLFCSISGDANIGSVVAFWWGEEVHSKRDRPVRPRVPWHKSYYNVSPPMTGIEFELNEIERAQKTIEGLS